jgi:kinetochore protein Mis12/MTW1
MSRATAMPPGTLSQTAQSLLLCETLGFSPQLLLDDIINIANNAVQDGVNGMEEFLQKWADERGSRDTSSPISVEATTHEVEQGLVAFQTLLEYHTDIAFDFFEAWCLRNIFVIPPELSVVLPHQESLDLTVKPDQAQPLLEEVEELRKRLDGVCPILFFNQLYGLLLDNVSKPNPAFSECNPLFDTR